MANTRVYVFTGPTLDKGTVLSVLEDADVRPPVSRGDVLNILSSEPEDILIIDGGHYPNLAVTHKELLLALEQGVRVWGCSGVGALRAAELNCFGMRGLGNVYQCFARGELVGDDEVYVSYRADNFTPLTIALVDLRFALDEYRLNEVLDEQDKGVLIALVKALPFYDRTPSSILNVTRESSLSKQTFELVQSILNSSSLFIKRRDAIESLHKIKEFCEKDTIEGGLGKTTKGFEPVTTMYLSHFREHYITCGAEYCSPSPVQVFGIAQLHYPGIQAFIRETTCRFIQSSEALYLGVKVPHIFQSLEDIYETQFYRQLRDLLRIRNIAPLDLIEEIQCRYLSQAAIEQYSSDSAVISPIEALMSRMGLRQNTNQRRPNSCSNEDKYLIDLVLRQGDLIPAWVFIRAFKFVKGFEFCRRAAIEANRLREVILEKHPNLKMARYKKERVLELYSRLWNIHDQAELSVAARSRGFSSLQAILETADDFFLCDFLTNEENYIEMVDYKKAIDQLQGCDLTSLLDDFLLYHNHR